MSTELYRRARGFLATKKGRQTAGWSGGISAAALLAVATPDYLKVRDEAGMVPELKKQVEDQREVNRKQWTKIDELEKVHHTIDKRIDLLSYKLDNNPR